MRKVLKQPGLLFCQGFSALAVFGKVLNYPTSQAPVHSLFYFTGFSRLGTSANGKREFSEDVKVILLGSPRASKQILASLGKFEVRRQIAIKESSYYHSDLYTGDQTPLKLSAESDGKFQKAFQIKMPQISVSEL